MGRKKLWGKKSCEKKERRKVLKDGKNVNLFWGGLRSLVCMCAVDFSLSQQLVRSKLEFQKPFIFQI